MTRFLTSLVWMSIGLLPVNGFALQPALDEDDETAFEQVAELADEVRSLIDYKDNYYLYTQKIEEARQTAAAIAGSEIEVEFSVIRVNQREVLVEPKEPARGQLILAHATGTRFGNLETVLYSGPPSAARANRLSKPFGLRIGSEIDLEKARSLRKHDIIKVRGILEPLQLEFDEVFKSRLTATVVGWAIVRDAP